MNKCTDSFLKKFIDEHNICFQEEISNTSYNKFSKKLGKHMNQEIIKVLKTKTVKLLDESSHYNNKSSSKVVSISEYRNT